MAFVETKIKRA